MTKKILISQARPAGEHNPYGLLEHHHDVSVDFQTFVHMEGLTAKEFREQHINPLDYTAVIFNSKLSIDHYFRLCQAMRITVPDTMHYYCQNESVGNYLQKYIEYRKRRVFFGENNRFEDVVPAMLRRPQEKYLMVVGDNFNEDILRMFASHKIEVKPAVMYRMVTTPWPDNKPFDYDIVAFFTASGVHAFLDNFPDYEQGHTAFVCFGCNTEQAVEAAGFRVDKRAPLPGCPSVLSAIEQYLTEQEDAQKD